MEMPKVIDSLTKAELRDFARRMWSTAQDAHIQARLARMDQERAERELTLLRAAYAPLVDASGREEQPLETTPLEAE